MRRRKQPLPHASLNHTVQIGCVVFLSCLAPLWARSQWWRLPLDLRLGLPFLGIADIPKDYEWRHWAKHKAVYGPVSSMCVLGQLIIILNSLKACEDEKRSAIYSGRPVLQFAGEMIGWNLQIILSLAKFCPAQEREVLCFLARISENPDNFLKDLRLPVAAISLKMVYGYAAKREKKDPLLTLIDTAADEFR
jgi:hypothetical protein